MSDDDKQGAGEAEAQEEETAKEAEAPEAEVKEEPKEEAPKEEKKEEPKKEEKKEKKADVKLSKDAQKVLDMVKKMSLMEVADLVTAMEDEFGVSAAAPVAAVAAAPAGGGDAGGGEEKDSYDVELTAGGSQKIAVIKVVKELAGLGLKEAKDIVDAAPKVFMEGVKTADAEEAKKKLEEAGATCTLK